MDCLTLIEGTEEVDTNALIAGKVGVLFLINQSYSKITEMTKFCLKEHYE